MPPLQWSSWIADEEGRVDYTRVRQLVSVLLGMAGGVVVVGVSAGWRAAHIDPSTLLLSASVLVIPVTGGKIMDHVAKVRAQRDERRSSAILRGEEPGRRSSDSRTDNPISPPASDERSRA